MNNNSKISLVLVLSGILCGNQAFAYDYNVYSAYRFNSSIKTAFYMAALDNKPDRVRQYINLGYSIDTRDENGMTALCTAKLEGEDEAFDVLLSYGANPYDPCMAKARELRVANIKAKMLKYGGLTLLGGALGGTAIALASGGGGGGSDSDSGNGGGSVGKHEDYVPGSNGKIDNVNDWSEKVPAVLPRGGEKNGNFSEIYLNNLPEFNGSALGGENSYTSSVNFLGAINAAPAFVEMYNPSTDSGVVADYLMEVNVGVIDTGVWGNHKEFMSDSGSKVTGYNFDYGPCLNGDTSNCWRPTETESVCLLGECIQEVELLNQDGEQKDVSVVSCTSSSLFNTCNPYNKWAAVYPSNYDWDQLKYYFYPNEFNEKLDGGASLHGSNVAGIIAANFNNVDEGMMGVAGVKTTITAVRYDLMSSLADPLLRLLEDDVLAVNLSLGSIASEGYNASTAQTANIADYMSSKEINAFHKIMDSYEVSENGTDGMIIVKAGGNDKFYQPDFTSGLKLNAEFKDLMMLVVVAVDVTLDGNFKVSDYQLSSFSNKCGATSSYCIAAPGGNYTQSGGDLMYSVGTPNTYYGMAGTSQATPVVTGSIAFLKSAYPYMKSSQIIELILETANKNASDYSASIYGAGLLDLGKAVEYVSSGNGLMLTALGNNINEGKLNISSAHLSVPSRLNEAVMKALPKTITVFDKYNRPFAVNTANYVSTTHGSYKELKSDVEQISRLKKVQKTEKDGISFAFAGSADNANGNGMGFMMAEYKTEKQQSGFFFNENTRYKNGEFFADTTANPFMAMNDAYGVYSAYNFNDNIGLKLEAVTGQNGLYDGESSVNDETFDKQAYAMNAELQLHKGDKFGFSLMSGVLYEKGAMLGLNGDGALGANDSGTYNAGVKASWYATPKLTLSGSYFRGYTEAQSFDSNLLSTTSLQSESFAFDANYKYSKTTAFGFNVSSPLRVVSGSLKVNFPSGRDNYSDTVYFNRYKASLKPQAREYKFSLYASHDIGENLSLRSQADVRVNPEHQRQENDYRALFGMVWNFN